jgi:hypothetical protein
MNSSKFDDMTEVVVIINTIPLHEPLDNEKSFIAVNRTVSLPLNFINSFAIDDIPVGTRRNQMPSILAHKSREF